MAALELDSEIVELLCAEFYYLTKTIRDEHSQKQNSIPILPLAIPRPNHNNFHCYYANIIILATFY